MAIEGEVPYFGATVVCINDIGCYTHIMPFSTCIFKWWGSYTKFIRSNESEKENDNENNGSLWLIDQTHHLIVVSLQSMFY